MQNLAIPEESRYPYEPDPDADDEEDKDLDGYSMATSLRSLNLTDVVILDWLAKLPTVPALQQLSVEDVTVGISAKLAMLLPRIADSLTYLQLSVRRATPYLDIINRGMSLPSLFLLNAD